MSAMEIELDSAPEQIVLSALRQGQRRQAAHLLVRYYGLRIYARCAALTDLERAEDLTQASFARALGSLESLRGQSSVRQWLEQVADAVCAEQLGDVVGSAAGKLAAPAPGHAERADEPQLSESLQRRLQMLAASL